MKIRRITTAILFLALMLIIWCMTPPETHLIIKIALTICVIAFSIIAATQTIIDTIKRFLTICKDTVVKAGQDLTTAIDHFINWCCEVPPNIVANKRDEIDGECHRHMPEERRAINRPIRRICRRIDFTATCSFIAISFTGGIILHYHDLTAIILLNLFDWLLIYVLSSFISNSSIGIDDSSVSITSTVPIVGMIATVFQFFIPIIQLIGTIATIHNEIVSTPAYEPFFTFNLYFYQFHLTPFQAVIAASSILCLTGFGYLCTAVHHLVYPPKDQP